LHDPRPTFISKSTEKPTSKAADALDIAARYLVYKLYDRTGYYRIVAAPQLAWRSGSDGKSSC
jgi:hypothetical protein